MKIKVICWTGFLFLICSAGAYGQTRTDVTSPLPRGLAPVINISVTPAPIYFGNVNVGQVAQQTITISNEADSNEALTGSVGLLSAPFSIVSGRGAFNLPPGQSVTVIVQFSPTTAGVATAGLSITHNATNRSPLMVALSGIGIGANVSVTPMSYGYGSVKVNRSKSASFAVTNNGETNLTISSTSITGTDASMFTISGGRSKTIKSGKNLTVRVTFKPTSTGAMSAALAITSNDPVTPTVNIPLTGTGQ